MSAHQNSRFERHLITILKGFNSFLHVLLAIALVVASGMVVWDFGLQVGHAFTSEAVGNGHLAQAFLHALGTLFIVWTLSSLIAAEIEYVATAKFHLRVFIEVAMITLLRQIIVEPVKLVAGTQDPLETLSLWHYGIVLVAILVIGIVHRLVGDTPATASRAEVAPLTRPVRVLDEAS